MGATWSVGGRGGSAKRARRARQSSAGTIAGSGRPAGLHPRDDSGWVRQGQGDPRGRYAARAILTDCIGDGRFDNVPYSFGLPEPGVYQPTPPAFSTSPLVPWVAQVRPFTMTSPSQFRPGPPPPLDSRRWAQAYQLTQAYGDVNSSIRTPEQSEIATFWTEHAVRQWNRNIRMQAVRLDLDALAAARLLAVTNTAMADAFIGCWDAKYHYSFWRPVTAIQQGDTDGRADTQGDPSWLPFQTTPNHPEYPAAHAYVSTAVSSALRHFFRGDETMFAMDAIVGGVTYVHTFTGTPTRERKRAPRGFTAACTMSSRSRLARVSVSSRKPDVRAWLLQACARLALVSFRSKSK